MCGFLSLINFASLLPLGTLLLWRSYAYCGIVRTESLVAIALVNDISLWASEHTVESLQSLLRQGGKDTGLPLTSLVYKP
jgi:hypothetical protein